MLSDPLFTFELFFRELPRIVLFGDSGGLSRIVLFKESGGLSRIVLFKDSGVLKGPILVSELGVPGWDEAFMRF